MADLWVLLLLLVGVLSQAGNPAMLKAVGSGGSVADLWLLPVMGQAGESGLPPGG